MYNESSRERRPRCTFRCPQVVADYREPGQLIMCHNGTTELWTSLHYEWTSREGNTLPMQPVCCFIETIVQTYAPTNAPTKMHVNARLHTWPDGLFRVYKTTGEHVTRDCINTSRDVQIELWPGVNVADAGGKMQRQRPQSSVNIDVAPRLRSRQHYCCCFRNYFHNTDSK